MNSTLLNRLEKAAKEYTAITRERVILDQINPEAPETRPLYDGFRQRPFGLGFGANDGDWLAFRLGIKPMIREFIPISELENLQQICTANGWFLETLEAPINENRINGLFTTDSSEGFHSQQQATQNCFVYIGKEREGLSFIRNLDVKTLHSSYKKKSLKHVDTHVKIGELQGYPKCCIKAFCKCLGDNRQLLKKALARTATPQPLLNNLSLSAFHYVCWTPCRFDCPESLKLARRIDAHLAEISNRNRQNALRYLSMPRLYIDDRRQILFDGEKHPDGTISYTSVYSPYNFDQCRETVDFDWVFYAACVSRFLRGDQLRVSRFKLEVFKDGRVVDRIKIKPKALFFAFESFS